ncbi:MAG: glycosyltransferase N-terminal domain-containing protein [Bacteroidota bacterium]|nr:glycosyltransferase N-terminal domain-containing protein [Bacteroidota bacterium]
MFGVIFYRIFLFVFPLLASFYGIFNKKARLWSQGQKGLISKIKEKFAANNQEVIWVHVSSLGEFEQARTLIEMIFNKWPQYRIVLTFFSSSGYEARKTYPFAKDVFYLPFDSPKNSAIFIDILKPKAAFFVRYDLWYYYLSYLYKINIPTFLISAYFHPKSKYFSWYGSFLRLMLQKFTAIFTTDDSSIDKLKKLSIKAKVCGDTRFDRVIEIYNNRTKVPHIQEFKANSKIIVLGSTWSEDIIALSSFINDIPFLKTLNLKIIIVPRYLDDVSMNVIHDKIKIPKIFYSDIESGSALDEHVLVVNKTGFLSSIYQYADIAFVGCSFAKGLHNTLEPGVYGIPVIFGPKYVGTKDKDPMILIKQGGMFCVNDALECMNLIKKILKDETLAFQAGRVNKDYIFSNGGATQKIMEYIIENKIL